MTECQLQTMFFFCKASFPSNLAPKAYFSIHENVKKNTCGILEIYGNNTCGILVMFLYMSLVGVVLLGIVVVLLVQSRFFLVVCIHFISASTIIFFV